MVTVPLAAWCSKAHSECGVVMNEVLNVPDNVPQAILDKAECVVVIPSMTKVPIAFGGSFGLQLGAESIDIVLMVMNSRGVEALLTSKVKLGGDSRRTTNQARPAVRAVFDSLEARKRLARFRRGARLTPKRRPSDEA